MEEGDCGVYKVKFGMKVDSYRVELNDYVPNAPEFGTVVGILTVLSALSVFFFIRFNCKIFKFICTFYVTICADINIFKNA